MIITIEKNINFTKYFQIIVMEFITKILELIRLTFSVRHFEISLLFIDLVIYSTFITLRINFYKIYN